MNRILPLALMFVALGACDDMADQLAAIAPGFDTALMDGPDGYGVYLTYVGEADWGD